MTTVDVGTGSAGSETSRGAPRRPFLLYFLGIVALVFIGMLVFTWVATNRANPVILDEKGAPR